MGVGGVEFGDLIEIRKLLKYQHVVAAVVCLGERPMRYGELGSAVSDWIGSRISDSEITRTIHRLEELHFAESIHDDGHRLFRLTPAGRRYLDAVRSLGRALDPPPR